MINSHNDWFNGKPVEYHDHRAFSDLPVNYISQTNGRYAVYISATHSDPKPALRTNVVAIWKRKELKAIV